MSNKLINAATLQSQVSEYMFNLIKKNGGNQNKIKELHAMLFDLLNIIGKQPAVNDTKDLLKRWDAEREESKFKYSAAHINKLIDDMPEYSVCMAGVHEDIKRLKNLLSEIYDEFIFLLSYWATDAPYHGWLWSNEEHAKMMRPQLQLTDDLTHKWQEMYAMCLKALGEREKEE